MTKSRAAFLLSVDKLFDIGERVYFWTFTFKNVLPDWWYPSAWRAFARAVHKLYGGYVCGLRVIEIHPSGHGLHYHLLVNRRLNIHLIRRICEPLGIFWVHVVRRPVRREAGYYLAKYLTKQFAGKLHGLHRWESFGCFRSCRKNSIIIESPYMKARRRAKVGKVPYGYEDVLRRVFEVHGSRGLRICWRHLRNGRLFQAATMVSPHIRITPAGGIKYFKPFVLIRAREVCRH